MGRGYLGPRETFAPPPNFKVDETGGNSELIFLWPVAVGEGASERLGLGVDYMHVCLGVRF